MPSKATETPVEWKYTYKCTFCNREYGSDKKENKVKVHKCPLCFATYMGWDKKWYKQVR